MELSDIVGKRVGKLVVLKYVRSIKKGKRNDNHHYYLCKCDCGNEKEIIRDSLRCGRSPRSCGCIIGTNGGVSFNPTDLIGKQFDRLTVIAYNGNKVWKCGRVGYFYKCQCKCGVYITATRQNLLYGHTASCGCLKNRKGEENKDWKGVGELSGRYWGHVRNHAEKRSLAFTATIQEAWAQFLKQGGVCALTNVAISMKSSKKENYRQTASLDRIDSSKGYETGNLQWLHKDLNRMKMALTQEKFIEWCCLVAEKHKSKNSE